MGGSDLLVDYAHRFGPATLEEGYVYGSCAPGWHSAGDFETVLEEWITDVQDEGIERVCCLLTGCHLTDEDLNLARYREAFGEENVCHAPIPDGRLVDQELLTETILPFLDESVESRSPVVVHCLSGVCRTGQVLSAWLVWNRGYDPEAAIEAVREGGRDPLEVVEQGHVTEEDVYELLSTLEDQ